MKTFSVDEILWAFIANAESATQSIRVSMAGTPWGYVRIKGPAGKHQVVIERYNATVAVEDVHSALSGVEPRPAKADDPVISSVHITEHPLGYSVGPQMGSLRWGISAKNLVTSYGAPAAFVRAIVDACANADSSW